MRLALFQKDVDVMLRNTVGIEQIHLRHLKGFVYHCITLTYYHLVDLKEFHLLQQSIKTWEMKLRDAKPVMKDYKSNIPMDDVGLGQIYWSQTVSSLKQMILSCT